MKLSLGPVVLSLFISLAAAPAMAYVGPGPGLSMLGSFFTLLAGIVFAFFMVLFYPVRLLIKKRKARKNSSNPPSA